MEMELLLSMQPVNGGLLYVMSSAAEQKSDGSNSSKSNLSGMNRGRNGEVVKELIVPGKSRFIFSKDLKSKVDEDTFVYSLSLEGFIV